MSSSRPPNTNPPEADRSENPEEKRSGSGVFGIVFPTDPYVWAEARKLVADRNLRVEDLATCTSQDPAIVLDLLKTANAMFFSGGKSPITATKTAIVRLGSELVIETFDKMRDREGFEDERIAHWFEIHRSRCRRVSIVCRLLAEALARTISDDCQAAALFMYVGEMLAVAHLKEQYVKLADENARSTVLYRLSNDFKFDTETVGLAYLRRVGIPEVLVAALDREARIRQVDRAIMKPLCLAAGEMIDAFDASRWDKLAPGKNLPPKSSLRLLQITESQYLKIYERASEYLFSARLLDEKKRTKEIKPVSLDDIEDIKSESAKAEEAASDGVNSDIMNLLNDIPAAADEAQEKDWEDEKSYEPPLKVIEEDDEDEDEELDETSQDMRSLFGLDDASQRPKTSARAGAAAQVQKEAPTTSLRSERVSGMLSAVGNIFEKAKNSEEVLTQLLEMLVDRGPFEKSALIVVSKDRSKAMVVAARGPGIEDRQVLQISNPLSPLAACFSKVQSFGNKESENSPFGSRSYALSPIDADHDSPVALYADCGNDGSVSFEARRVFRLVVEMLNKNLPQIAGGIPVEI